MAIDKTRGPVALVYVYDAAREPVGNARVVLRPVGGKGAEIELPFDQQRGCYLRRDVPQGRYLLHVEAPGYAPQEREVVVGPAGMREIILVERPGTAFYTRGRRRIPFEPLPDLVAVSLHPQREAGQEEALRAEFQRLRTREEEVPGPVRQDNVRLVRLAPGMGEQDRREVLQRLDRNPHVRQAGAVMHMDKETVSFLTNEVVVKFHPDVTREEVLALAGEYGLSVVRTLAYVGNAYVLRADAPADYELLERWQALERIGRVEYAEPNLVSTSVDDQVVPTDFLFAGQWHLPLIGATAAWQTLRNANPPPAFPGDPAGVLPGGPGDLTFGSENLILAVMDRGIQSNTALGVTSAAHPDFAANVTGGAAKVYRFFDFTVMVPNNDAPPASHGMGCAGVASAVAENPSVVPGETEGVVGAAPNCRVMGLIRPATRPEDEYSDAYAWTAGFHAGSTLAGFPAAITPAADIITNSFGESTGAPISALMAACFDLLTSYGRGRRGVVLFFSAGNGNIDFTLPRPWAAYPRTIAVAASTSAEVRAGYSNFGNGIDVCAPSSNGVGITSCDLLAAGNLAGHTGGALDYTNAFGGTSSATPLTAGVGVLMLTANAKLSWLEVRQLLQDTAVMIDPANADPVGQWVDTDGDGIDDYSQWYGHGRIDAAAAVAAAMAYTHDERDLVVRNSLVDDGVNGIAVEEVESPDIWATNVGLPVAVPPYASAPPHEVPKITVDPAIHIGTGRNDLEVSGVCTSAAEVTFTIDIDGTGASDTFQWSRDGGAVTAGVAITGAAQPLSDGVSVRFAAVTGHTLGDRWIVTARQVTRFLHVRVRNRGNQDYFAALAPAPNLIDAAMTRQLLCVSDGFPVSRFFSSAALPGPNDLQVISAYAGAAERAVYTVEITAAPGAPAGDSYRWNRDGGAMTAGALGPGALDVALNDGVNVRFGNHTGHTVGDRWVLYARDDDAFLNLDHYWEVAPGVAGEFDPASGRAGTRTLAETGLSGLVAGDTRVDSVAWPEALRLPTNVPTNPATKPTRPLRMFALGEVVPHDGALDGFTAEENNNFSYRELSFARFRFTTDNGLNELEGSLDVAVGIPKQQPFRVEVRTTAGRFRAQRVRVRLTATTAAGPEARTFRHDGAAWSWDGGAPAWAALNDPLAARLPDGTQIAAEDEEFDIQFDGTLTVDTTFTSVLIEAEILSDFRDHPVASGRFTVSVFAAAPMPTGVEMAAAAALLAPRSHVFADTATLTQAVGQAFGPEFGSATTRFRATALFQSTAVVNAYAVTPGFVALQRDPASADTVNLVLRPFAQPIAGFAPVRYFVYRGLRLTDFLHGSSAADEVKLRAQAGALAFITETWTRYLAQNAGATEIPSSVLGYDPATQTAADSLDDLFFRVGAPTQLPFVGQGMVLGRFHENGGAGTFGFEVVVEEGDYAPTLGYARAAAYEVVVTPLAAGASAADQFALRVAKEEVLNFMDPAAFYGLHMHDVGVLDHPGGIWTGQDVYSNVVERFHTKNQLYVDVRSENGSSLNFHANYDDGAGNQVQIGLASAAMAPAPYAASEWPLLIVDHSAPVNTANDYAEQYLQLPVDDNEDPVLYVEHGQLLTASSNGPFVRDAELLPAAPGQWTLTQGFRFPNTGPAGARKGVAWVLRMHYGRQQVAAPVVPIPGTVLRTAKYTDNVWGPIDRTSRWAVAAVPGTVGIKWISTQDNRYVDADTERGWRQMMECGLATQSGTAPERVLLYATVTASDTNQAYDFVPVRGVADGVSSRATFFDEPALFAGYTLEHDQVDDAGTIVRTLSLRQAAAGGHPPTSALLLGLEKAELDTLKALSAAGISTDYLRMLTLDAHAQVTDASGRSADRWRVGIQGLKTADGEFAQDFPAADIRVYSADGQLFASPAFAAAEPLPTVYARGYEEEKGTRLRPALQRTITAVAGADVTVAGWDGRREVAVGDSVKISGSAANDGQYTVASVALSGSDTVFTLTAPLPGNAPSLGSLFTVQKPTEEWGTDLDRDPALSGFDAMSTLVEGFAAAIAAIPNDAAAQAALLAAVQLWGGRILGRARVRAAADRSRADDMDRALYWARIRMGVALKGHAFSLASISGRNTLVAALESASRGYGANLAAAPGGARKVLLTGFDPYGLADDLEASSPSAAVALALHGQTLSSGPKQAYLETVVFPVRYADFDAGRVEALVDPLLAGAGVVSMIVTTGQNGSAAYADLERLAGRRRGGEPDNDFVGQAPEQVGTGAAFYESTLPAAAMVPGPFAPSPAATQLVVFDESYQAESPAQSQAHPVNGGANGSAATFPLASITGTAVEGSAGSHLANEVFYRVAHRRQTLASATLTGHVSVPGPQHAHVGIDTVILRVEEMIQDWLASLP